MEKSKAKYVCTRTSTLGASQPSIILHTKPDTSRSRLGLVRWLVEDLAYRCRDMRSGSPIRAYE